MDIQLRLALIYLLASPPPTNSECQHHWIKNGKKNGLQRSICKLCKKTITDGDRARGRQVKN
jgi:transposase-like protein